MADFFLVYFSFLIVIYIFSFILHALMVWLGSGCDNIYCSSISLVLILYVVCIHIFSLLYWVILLFIIFISSQIFISMLYVPIMNCLPISFMELPSSIRIIFWFYLHFSFSLLSLFYRHPFVIPSISFILPHFCRFFTF